MTRSLTATLTLLLLTAVPSGAFEATLSKASSISAAPVSGVARNALTPVDNVPVAAQKERPAYDAEGANRAQFPVRNIPVPVPRPAVGLGCPIVWQT